MTLVFIRKQTVLLIILSVALASMLGRGGVSAATRSVPSQYSSIQAAINAAGNGDVVLVSPGTYRENISIMGKYIELRANGAATDVILAPNAGQTGIMIQNVPYQAGAPRVKINGFRITGGKSPDGQGGAITAANNADPIIENNIIDNNRSDVHGGGILVFNNSHPTIRNNNINKNSAYMFGGAIFVVKNSSPVIYNNTINDNTASGAVFTNGGASGGGLYLENEVSNPSSKSKPVIIKNNIYNNTATFAGGAISLRVGVDAIIEENTISNNTASYGGGVHIETEGSNPVVANNTIQNNTASYSATFSGSGYGGGISVYAGSKPRIIQNQILGNAASRGGGGIVMSENSNSTVTANTISGNYVADAGYYEGGGIYIANSQANVTNNIVRSNTANTGGGIAILDAAIITAVNNTIVKNNATRTDIPAAGGGIFVRDNNTVQVTTKNNVIALNLDYQVFEERGQRANWTNNLITTDNDGMYFNWDTNSINDSATLNSSSSVNATGNISGSPGFVDSAANNYELLNTSIAKDAGVSTGAPADDYRRAARPFNNSYDIGAYEYTTETSFKSPIFRFWSNEYSSHFYASSTSERNTVVSSYPVQTWQYEFQAFDSFATQVANTTPVYRFYSQTYNAHFYTADEDEKNTVVNDYPDEVWLLEGTAYYAYPLSYNGSAKTVYRFWSPTYRNHFFTADEAEKNHVDSFYPDSIWTYENSRYKVPN